MEPKLMNCVQDVKAYEEKILEVTEIYKQAFPSPLKNSILTEKEWGILRKYYFNIQLHLTNRCNTSCKVCYSNCSPQETEKDNLTLNDIKFILKKIGNGKKITLFGGEPTIRDDIFEIIRLVKSSGNIVELFTNGLKLSEISYVKKLKENGIDVVVLSFSGFNKEFYKEIYGNENELTLRWKALKNLVKEKIPTYISCIIGKGLNEDEILKLISLVIHSNKNNGSLRGIKFYGLTHIGRFLTKKGYAITTPELIKIIEEKSNYEINLDYLLEFKKFVINLKKILTQFDIIFPSFSDLRGFYKVRSLKEFPSLAFLKKINKLLEKRGYQHLKILLNKNIIKHLLSLSFVSLREKIVKTEKLIEISLGNLVLSSNVGQYPYIPTIEVRKLNGVPIVNIDTMG